MENFEDDLKKDGFISIEIDKCLFYYRHETKYGNKVTTIYEEDFNEWHNFPGHITEKQVSYFVSICSSEYNKGIESGIRQHQEEMRKVLGLENILYDIKEMQKDIEGIGHSG